MSYLGIDLGTTNSAAVIYNDKKDHLEVVKIDGTDEILPSVVSYLEDGVSVGVEAKSGAIIYPETTVISVKRMMGSGEKIHIAGMEKSPEEVSAEILIKLKMSAEEQSGEKFDEVVITHPAYFNDRQIFATQQAGLIAGFKNVYLLSEPLSAAIEYGYRQAYAQTLLVYDLGGGTFDACVLRVSQDENGQEVFQELSDVGDMNLGGDDFDSELIRWMKAKFMEANGIDLDSLANAERKRVMQKLKQEAEQTKKKLSGTNKVAVRINPLVIVDGVPTHYLASYTGVAKAYHGDPGVASGLGKPIPGYVAVDPKQFPYGTKLWIVSNDGRYVYGYAIAADTGGFVAMNACMIDLYMPSEAMCEQWGARGVTVYVLDEPRMKTPYGG